VDLFPKESKRGCDGDFYMWPLSVVDFSSVIQCRRLLLLVGYIRLLA